MLHPLRPGAVVRIGREEDEASRADGLVGDGSRASQLVLAARESGDEEVLRAERGEADRRGAVHDRHHVVVVVQRPVEGADARCQRARLADGDSEEAARHVRVGGAQARGREAEPRGELGAAADADEAAAVVHPGAQRILARLAQVQRGDLGVSVRRDQDVDVGETTRGDVGGSHFLERDVPRLVEEPAEPTGGLARRRAAGRLQDADPREVRRQRRGCWLCQRCDEACRGVHRCARVAAGDVEEQRLAPRADVVEEVDGRIGRLVQHRLHPVLLALRKRDPVRAHGQRRRSHGTAVRMEVGNGERCAVSR